MMLYMRQILLFLSFYVLCSAAQSVEPNTKWGKPTAEELSMTVYAPDTSANAVVLYRSADVFYNYVSTGFRVFYVVKCRLKVLKPDGKEMADAQFVYRVPESSGTMCEYVSGPKAIAYNLENGKTVKTKMDKSMVNEERIDKNWKLVKFSVPQVKVGTVIEYEYKIESDYYFDLRDWYAQTNIPVVYTEYNLMIPEWFIFNIEESGIGTLERELTSGGLSIEGNTIATSEYHFKGHNLPALKDDDHVWCAEDYGCRVTHELREVVIPGQLYKGFSTTWEKVDNQLMEDEEFGGRIKKSSPLKDELQNSGIAAISDKQERATAVLQLLSKRVRWNGEYALWAKPASKVLKEGTGTNADINFLYINMLHDVGMEGTPVVLRSRSQGHLPLSHPSIKYLTTTVVAVGLSDSVCVFVDGSMLEDGCMNALPARLLADRARFIRQDGTGGWVSLIDQTQGKETIVIQAEIGADGLMKGVITRAETDEDAMERRKTWRTAKDSTEIVAKIEEQFGISVQQYERDGGGFFSNKVKEVMEFTKNCDTAGDIIYLNPLVFPPLSENPFKDPTRNLPVEFRYAHQQIVNIMLTIPDGYVIEDMAKPIIMKFDGINARVVGSLNGNILTMRFQLIIDKTFFNQTQYTDIKAFFDKVVESCNHLITLKKQP